MPNRPILHPYVHKTSHSANWILHAFLYRSDISGIASYRTLRILHYAYVVFNLSNFRCNKFLQVSNINNVTIARQLKFPASRSKFLAGLTDVLGGVSGVTRMVLFQMHSVIMLYFGRCLADASNFLVTDALIVYEATAKIWLS